MHRMGPALAGWAGLHRMGTALAGGAGCCRTGSALAGGCGLAPHGAALAGGGGSAAAPSREYGGLLPHGGRPRGKGWGLAPHSGCALAGRLAGVCGCPRGEEAGCCRMRAALTGRDGLASHGGSPRWKGRGA
jgi:hypothetical protein